MWAFSYGRGTPVGGLNNSSCGQIIAYHFDRAQGVYDLGPTNLIRQPGRLIRRPNHSNRRQSYGIHPPSPRQTLQRRGVWVQGLGLREGEDACPAQARAIRLARTTAALSSNQATYRGTSLTRRCTLLGPYSRAMPRALWGPIGEGGL